MLDREVLIEQLKAASSGKAPSMNLVEETMAADQERMAHHKKKWRSRWRVCSCCCCCSLLGGFIALVLLYATSPWQQLCDDYCSLARRTAQDETCHEKKGVPLGEGSRLGMGDGGVEVLRGYVPRDPHLPAALSQKLLLALRAGISKGRAEREEKPEVTSSLEYNHKLHVALEPCEISPHARPLPCDHLSNGRQKGRKRQQRGHFTILPLPHWQHATRAGSTQFATTVMLFESRLSKPLPAENEGLCCWDAGADGRTAGATREQGRRRWGKIKLMKRAEHGKGVLQQWLWQSTANAPGAAAAQVHSDGALEVPAMPRATSSASSFRPNREGKRVFAAGDGAFYWSTTHRTWLKCNVLSLNTDQDGKTLTYNLDCKSRVEKLGLLLDRQQNLDHCGKDEQKRGAWWLTQLYSVQPAASCQGGDLYLVSICMR
eukprot:g18929.t1